MPGRRACAWKAALVLCLSTACACSAGVSGFRAADAASKAAFDKGVMDVEGRSVKLIESLKPLALAASQKLVRYTVAGSPQAAQSL